jgi:hypothetical protein
MQKVRMSAVSARAQKMAAVLGRPAEEVEVRLLAAHDRANTKVIGTRPSTPKTFKPDGRVEVAELAPSFAHTVAMPAMQA